MTPYSHEEICEYCIYAYWTSGVKFWDGKQRFRRCHERAEREVNHTLGTCPKRMTLSEFRKLQKEASEPH